MDKMKSVCGHSLKARKLNLCMKVNFYTWMVIGYVALGDRTPSSLEATTPKRQKRAVPIVGYLLGGKGGYLHKHFFFTFLMISHK